MQSFFTMSTIYAIFSTFLVHPWYIKGLFKRKTLFKHYKSYYNISLFERNSTYIINIFLMSIVYVISWCSYIEGSYIYYLPSKALIIYILFVQIILISEYKKNFKNFFNPILYRVILIFLLIVSFIIILYSKEHTMTPQELKDYCNKKIDIAYILPNSSIPYMGDENLYTENNLDYFICNSTNRSKIIIIENMQNKILNNISIESSLTLQAKELRDRYPKQRIDKIGIVITKDNKVFKVYHIKEKKPFLKDIEYLIFKSLDDTTIIEID